MVLGAIAGVNNTPADARVGKGTTAPRARLEVAGGDGLLGAGRWLILTNDQQLAGELIPCP
jgi:hypothetical protein